MRGKERILSFFHSKELLNAPKKLSPKRKPENLSSPCKEVYSFSQEDKEVNLNTEDEFSDYSPLKDAPLRVKNKENNFFFDIAYGIPFFVPREQSFSRELFLVYLPREIEEAKRDIERFLVLSWSSIYLIVEEEKYEKYLSLVTLSPKITLIFCKKNKRCYAMKELWNLAHKFPHSLIFYFLGSDIVKKGLEEEISSSLLDSRWIEILSDFPSIDMLAWKANSEGYVWYNAFWIKSSYLVSLKEPPENKKNFYYMEWLTEKLFPYSVLQTCRDKCNLGEYYYS